MVLGVNRGAAGCAQAMHAALSATPPPAEGDGEREGSALIAADAGGKPGSGNEWAGERRDREDSAIYSGDRPDGVLVPAQAAAPEAADEAGVQVRTDAPFSGPPPRPSLRVLSRPSHAWAPACAGGAATPQAGAARFERALRPKQRRGQQSARS